MFDLLTGEQYFNRDSRSIYPSDNYALEDVSGIMYNFQNDILYTGTYLTRYFVVGTRAGLLHIWSITEIHR